MAGVPSSGSLSMQDIACEKVYDNYALPTDGFGAGQRAAIGTISLTDLSTSGNSNGSGTSFEINNITNLNANKPNGLTSHNMSEFYKYEHGVSVAVSNGAQSFSSSGGTGTASAVTHAEHSTWYVSSKPTWVTINSGNFGSSNKDTGDGSVTFTVASNSSSARSGTIVVTFDVGTTNGGVGTSNSTTTRSIGVTQSSGSGGPPPPGGGGNKP